LYNNGNVNVKYLKKSINYNVSIEEVYSEVIEEKERFLDEDLDDKKKKDNKKVDKLKDDKKKLPGKKGEEVERKKEIYYESYTTKLCDSIVINLHYNGNLIKLWQTGDIQFINNNSGEVYRNITVDNK